jgi:pilus assembly protein Flp/PilA
MKQFLRKIGQAAKRYLGDECAASAVEYGVLLALIITVCIGAITTLGTSLNNTFATVNSTLPSGS